MSLCSRGGITNPPLSITRRTLVKDILRGVKRGPSRSRFGRMWAFLAVLCLLSSACRLSPALSLLRTGFSNSISRYSHTSFKVMYFSNFLNNSFIVWTGFFTKSSKCCLCLKPIRNALIYLCCERSPISYLTLKNWSHQLANFSPSFCFMVNQSMVVSFTRLIPPKRLTNVSQSTRCESIDLDSRERNQSEVTPDKVSQSER